MSALEAAAAEVLKLALWTEDEKARARQLLEQALVTHDTAPLNAWVEQNSSVDMVKFRKHIAWAMSCRPRESAFRLLEAVTGARHRRGDALLSQLLLSALGAVGDPS